MFRARMYSGASLGAGPIFKSLIDFSQHMEHVSTSWVVHSSYSKEVHETKQSKKRHQRVFCSCRTRAAARGESGPQNGPHAWHAYLCMEGWKGRRGEAVKHEQTARVWHTTRRRQEHAGPKKGTGAFYGRKAAAKKASNRRRRGK